VQGVEDEVLALVGARMTRDLLGAAGDYHLMDVTADQLRDRGATSRTSRATAGDAQWLPLAVFSLIKSLV
jgi:hypothetical protein